MLAFNTTLRRLDLSRNIRLGGAGVAGLARGLAAAEASSLQDLVLSQVAADSKVGVGMRHSISHFFKYWSLGSNIVKSIGF
jgi:hypothetical protein